MSANIGALDSIVKPLEDVTSEQVSSFENLSKCLRFKYQLKMFSNPSLQSFYAQLEASVYEEEVKSIEDLTLPDLDRQDENIGPDLIRRIVEEFGEVNITSI